MRGGITALLPLLFLAGVVVSSGCINLDPQALAMANPMIQDFLEEHPNADIKITHFSAAEAENMLEEIRSDCDNPYIGAKEYYRVNITDPDTDFFAVVWVDWESKQVECAWKLGIEGKETDKPKEDQGCEHHAKYMCKSGHIYWFDSCGNKEDKKDYCPDGCQDGDKKCSGGEGCKSHAEYKCYGDHVYWFNSCGNKEEKKEYCNEGCENGFCKGTKTCEEVGGYCMYPEDDSSCEVESDSTTGMIHADSPEGDYTCAVSIGCKEGYVYGNHWCPENGLCCMPKQECESKYEVKCYSGHVYWYDSCGNKQEKKEYCNHGCDGGACLEGEDGCFETDDGYDIYEKGVAEAGESRLEDHCNSDGTLTEKYCEGDSIKAKTAECPEGYVCEDAACVQEEIECAEEGEMCAGIAGIECCDELNCFIENESVTDASGICIECRDDSLQCYTGELECCEGLTEVEHATMVNETCTVGECGTICIECGNGVCEDNENSCTCPEDCV